MLAVMKTAPGVGNVALCDIAAPTPAPGHVLLAVRAAGICGTDLHIYQDEFPSRPPVVLGHEVAGAVVAVGDGVDSTTIGRRVTTETYYATCGRCRFCRGGRPNLCPERRSIGSAVNGGFAPYLVVPVQNLHTLPEHISFQAGALTEPLACVVHAVLEQSRVSPGELAVIAGPGAIGLLTLQVVQAAGARAIVIGTGADEQRLALARSLGAFAALRVDDPQLQELLGDLTGGDGVDLVYECAGAGSAAQQLLKYVRRGGRYVQIGLFSGPVSWDLNQLCLKELTVTGSNASTSSAWRTAVRLLETGAVQTEALISHRFPLERWQEAFDIFVARAGAKLVLEPA
jgi:L-iditol 2-dehydrogenase